MAFETPTDDPIGAQYILGFRYVGGQEEHTGTLFFNMITNIGDLEPVAAQEEAFQALVDLVHESSGFELMSASRNWSIGQTVTPTNPTP